MKVFRGIVVVVLLAMGLIWWSDRSKNDTVKATALTDSLANALSSAPDMEQIFVSTVMRARDVYNAAPNDMAKGASRPARAQNLCRLLKSAAITQWTGVVSQLSSNNDGKGVLAVQIGPSIYLKTWNNSLSDTSDRTLIEPNSPLHARAVALAAGSRVTFSGSFIPNQVDCVREGSLSLRGSLTEPEFIFRFTDIAAQ